MPSRSSTAAGENTNDPIYFVGRKAKARTCFFEINPMPPGLFLTARRVQNAVIECQPVRQNMAVPVQVHILAFGKFWKRTQWLNVVNHIQFSSVVALLRRRGLRPIKKVVIEC